MRRLDRGPAPSCLAAFVGGRDPWDHRKNPALAACKTAIRAGLDAMQGRRCAYCEGDLAERGQHIEHFRSRHQRPQATYAWDNLFLSCDASDSCGRHKDRVEHDADDLIDPCLDDPDVFLKVRSDGFIEPRPRIDPEARRRAVETVRVFNLNLDRPGHRSLCARRREVLRMYQAREPGIMEALADFSAADRADFIRSELAATAGEQFSTIIRHFFVDDF